MASIAEIINIINDGPLLFKIAVITGIILIIIAAIPPLSIFFLKSEKLTLTRNQSVMLTAIGCIFIIGGLAGTLFLFEATNIAPQINGIDIIPKNITEFGIGSTIFVTVSAIDPDRNILQNITSEPVLLYELIIFNHTEKNFSWGPDKKNHFEFQVGPQLEGLNRIRVIVTDRPKGEKDAKEAIYNISNYRISISHVPPEIEVVSPKGGSSKHVYKRIMIKAKAMDSDNQELYYKFYNMSPTSDRFSEIPPQNDYHEEIRYWIPREIGENIIRVEARVGDENGPWMDIRPSIKELIINVTDK